MSWQSVRSDALAEARILRAGTDRARTEELRTRMEQVLALLETTNDQTHDPETNGALAALLLGRLREPLLEYWLALGGPGFAIACAAHERRFIAVHPKTAKGLDLGVRSLDLRTPLQTAIALDVPTWEVLAKAMKHSKKADRAAAQSIVRDARASVTTLGLATWIDSAALLGDEAIEDVERARTLEPAEWSELAPWFLHLVPALVTSPNAKDAAIELVERLDIGLLNAFSVYAKPFVGFVGNDATKPLIRVLADMHRSQTADIATSKAIAEALATIDSPEVLEFFQPKVESRLIGKVAAAYLVSRTSSSRAALVHEAATEETAARSKRAKSAARKVTAKKRTVAAVATAREATTDELPWVLREPPWRHEHAVPPLPALTLPPRADYVERVQLSESDREGIDENTVIDDDDPVGLLAQKDLAAVPTLFSRPRAEVIRALRFVDSPRVAEWLFEDLGGPRHALVRSYIEGHPEAVAAAVVPALVGAGPKHRRTLAVATLMVANGQLDALREEAALYGAEDALTSALAAARLCDVPRDLSRTPEWIALAKLPSLLLANGARLAREHVETVLQAMALGIRELRSEFEPVSLDLLLTEIVDQWIRGKKWSESWVLGAAASLGGADVARLLAKYAKEWARERGSRERAETVVAALGSGELGAAGALSDLTRGSARGLAEHAELALRSLAKRAQISTDDLEDLAAPTFDLDASGRAELDFGPRRFAVTIADDLSARVVDEAGRHVSSLRAQKADDPAKSRVALDRFKSLKKALAEATRRSALRFELGMAAGRTWRAELFERSIARHPILGHVARRLVWACRERGGPEQLVRVSEDGSLATRDDEHVPYGPRQSLRVVHLLELSDKDARAWGDLFADYEIIQPFAQLGRTVFTPTEDEAKGTTFTRFQGKPALQMAIQGRLVARGWDKLTSAYVKRMGSVTAEYTLVNPLYFGEDFVNETTLGIVTFNKPIAKVPEIIFSEAIFDLHVLALDKPLA